MNAKSLECPAHDRLNETTELMCIVVLSEKMRRAMRSSTGAQGNLDNCVLPLNVQVDGGLEKLILCLPIGCHQARKGTQGPR
jgi:hypothetical protein